MNYAIVKDRVIINICVWDGVASFQPGEDCELVAMDTLPTGVGMGWINRDGEWFAPET